MMVFEAVSMTLGWCGSVCDEASDWWGNKTGWVWVDFSAVVVFFA